VNHKDRVVLTSHLAYFSRPQVPVWVGLSLIPLVTLTVAGMVYGYRPLGSGPEGLCGGLGRDHGWVSAMMVVRSGSRACGYSVRPLQSV
jgi:hypothetical protein